jgi:flagellar biogenesis protein FliO
MKWLMLYVITCVVVAAVIVLALIAAVTWLVVTLLNRKTIEARGYRQLR